MSPPLAFPGPSEVPGFAVPLHRSLTEPILLGGAPRAIAIAVGTLAAAVGIGLQLWIAGLAIWISRPRRFRLADPDRTAIHRRIRATPAPARPWKRERETGHA